MTAPTYDVAQLAGLLRREPSICTSCAAAKLALSPERVLDAVVALGRTAVIEQGLNRCPLCEKTQWVLGVVPVPGRSVPELGRILVVEDQRVIADLLRDLLGGLGYAVTIAGTGEEALSVASVYRPDAILLDLGLPGLPGHAVLQELQRLDAAVPVVIISGNKNPELDQSTRAAGAFDYLAKPFGLQVLERVVAAAIGEHERRTQQPQS